MEKTNKSRYFIKCHMFHFHIFQKIKCHCLAPNMGTHLTFFCWEPTWVSGTFGWPCPRLQQPRRFQIHYNSRQPCLGQHRVCICPVPVLHCISWSAPLYLSRPSIVFLSMSRLFPPPQASSFHSGTVVSSPICTLWIVVGHMSSLECYSPALENLFHLHVQSKTRGHIFGGF